MLFAFCCDRGAPGATTTALALAAARGKPAVVVEADPYGGALALRLRPGGKVLAATPTVLGLGAGRSTQQPVARPLAQTPDEPQRNEPRRLDLWRTGSHALNDLVRVVPGFMTAEHGASLSWSALTATLSTQSVPVFADVGRIHKGSPSMPIAAAADALIMVCRGDLGSVQHMIWRLEQLVPAIAEKNGRPPLVLPVVVTGHRSGARHAGQVADLLGETAVGPTLRGVGWIAWDPAGVSALVDGSSPWAKPLSRSQLMQSARKVMWLLGMATGLDHATPQEIKKKRGRRATDDSQTQPAGQPAGGDPSGWSAAEAPPAWTPSQQAPAGPAPGEVPVEKDGTSDEPQRRWQSPARSREGS